MYDGTSSFLRNVRWHVIIPSKCTMPTKGTMPHRPLLHVRCHIVVPDSMYDARVLHAPLLLLLALLLAHLES